MRIQFFGHEFDLFDEGARKLACVQYAEHLMQSIPGDAPEPVEILLLAFHELLTSLTSYWLMSGATLQSAKAAGCAGISMDQALEMHNFLAPLIGQKPMELVKRGAGGADAAHGVNRDAARAHPLPAPAIEGDDAE